MKNYRQEIWDLAQKFDNFELDSIPHSKNYDVGMLSKVASKLLPTEIFSLGSFSAGIFFKPSILDNIQNWRVFDYDDQIDSTEKVEKKSIYNLN